jgi:prephenate dehydrogenase
MTVPPGRVLIVGTGLIGTSIALALRAAGTDVFLSDFDPAVARLAADLGAGLVVPDLRDAKGIAEVAVLAMPPAYVGPELLSAQDHGVAEVYTDVASVKVLPVAQARALGCDISRYVPAHPLAGRERPGPAAAQADLFLGRTWALCPLPETSPDAVAAVTALVVACGAVPVITDPPTHDRWVALVSHAPHLVAAAMAARLAPSAVPGDALKLAGQGIRDVTRIAAGDTALWTQILAANAGPVAEVVAAVAEDLAAAARALAAVSASDGPEPAELTGAPGVTGLLDRGLAGVARIPGKHGEQPRNFAVVQVVIADQPGELARLFDAADAAGVNIEDIRLEHSPGLPVGVAQLSIRPDQVVTLLDAMEAGGWPVRRLPASARLPPPPLIYRFLLTSPSPYRPVRQRGSLVLLGPNLYRHLRHIGHGSATSRATSALT